jgi:VCBS repeat-containing protein
MQRWLTVRRTRRSGGAAAVGLTLPFLVKIPLAQAAPASAADLRAGAVYTLTNSAAGNAVAVFARAADGSLTSAGLVPTGGIGTGASLGSQGALALSKNGQWLYAVNAGSNSISVLRVTNDGLVPVQTIPSGGQMPISLTVSGQLLYVLNAGGSGNITGFVIGSDGTLTPLAGSTRGFGGAATGPAQISFTPDGSMLVVTEKNANAIIYYTVGADGLPSGPNSRPSSGATPFGFDFAGRDVLVVSEAGGGPNGGSAVSSYQIAPGLPIVSPSVADHQGAACWVVATENGRFAYTANAASDSISGFSVGATGKLKLLDPSGVTASVGAGKHPTDMAVSAGSRYLYVLQGVAGGGIAGYAIGPDGSLSPVGVAGALPAGTIGLAAR